MALWLSLYIIIGLTYLNTENKNLKFEVELHEIIRIHENLFRYQQI